MAYNPRSPNWFSIQWDKMAADLLQVAKDAGTRLDQADWDRAMKAAIDPVTQEYRSTARSHADTGTLAAAVNKKYVDYDGVHYVITGPKYTRPGSNSGRNANHAWLTEYGTEGPRQPGFGKKSKAPALMVDNLVNRTREPMNALEFATADPTKYAFTMSNKRRGFRMRLKPGQKYGAMPRGDWMADSYLSTATEVKRLTAMAIERIIGGRTK